MALERPSSLEQAGATTSHPSMQNAQRPVLGLWLMLAATMAFVAMQTMVKLGRQFGLHTSEVMFLRTAPGLPVLWYMLHRRGHDLIPRAPKNLFVRSLFGSLAMGTNFASMRSLSLAQFSTLGLSQPVFVALASPVFLREPVRGITWLAMALSFSGAWILLDPSAADRDVPLLPALLALGSALSSSVAHIWVRIATELDPPERVVFYFSAWVSLVALAWGLSDGHFRAIPPTLEGPSWLGLVLGLASFGTLGQLLMTKAYVHVEAARVSIVGYSSIAFSMLVDQTLWHIAPSSHAVLGGLLMLSAGYLLVRSAR
jgi:drug/metabolite transporter (DMT)-like permease